jgi:multiple sugar transport system permease protein
MTVSTIAGSRTPTRVRLPRRRRNRARRFLVAAGFGAPAAAILAILSLYPLVLLLRMSLSDVEVGNLLRTWPFVGLANFAEIFADPRFWSVSVQTLFFVGSVLVITMTIGTLFALALRRQTRFTRVTQTAMILVWTLPPIVVGSLWKFLLASDGSVNALLVASGVVSHGVPFLSEGSTALAAVAAVTLWAALPFSAMVIKSALLDVPPDIIAAARIDGATSRQVVTRIMLPMIRPTLLIVGILSVVGAFKAFDFIFVMTRGGPGTASMTIPFLGYRLAFTEYHFGLAGAVSVMAMLVVLALAIAYIWALRREER